MESIKCNTINLDRVFGNDRLAARLSVLTIRRFGNKIPLPWAMSSAESFFVSIPHRHQLLQLLMSRLSFMTTGGIQEPDTHRHRCLWQTKNTSKD